MKRRDPEEERLEGEKLCPKCGNVMVEEDGGYVCSHCDTEIDFLGDDENEDETE